MLVRLKQHEKWNKGKNHNMLETEELRSLKYAHQIHIQHQEKEIPKDITL